MSRRSRREEPQTYVFLGISGSGKGAQAQLLARALRRAHHIETGQLLRKHMHLPTAVWRYVRAVLARGDRVASWAAVFAWLSEFAARIKPREYVIFDGSPRTASEAAIMDEVMETLGRSLPVAIYLALSEHVARSRLLRRGRHDDTEAAIHRRFRYFRRDVLPVIAYYRTRRRLITINGAQPVPAVWRDIKKALHP